MKGPRLGLGLGLGIRRRASLVLVSGILACGGDPSAPALAPEGGTVLVDHTDGLRQELTFQRDPAGDAPQDFVLRSRILNRGSTPAFIRYRVCFLHDSDIDTVMRHEIVALPGCTAIEASHALAPGDSTQSAFYYGRNLSGPGAYDVRIRQLLDPERWASIRVRFD